MCAKCAICCPGTCCWCWRSACRQPRAPRSGWPPARILGTEAGRLAVGQPADLCVFDLGLKQGDVIWDLVRIELKGKTFAEIRDTLYRLLRVPNLKRCCIDSTGLGMQLAENAAKKFPGKVTPITFSRQVKSGLAIKAKRRFQDKSVRVPDDRKTQYELYSIKQKPSGDTLIITNPGTRNAL